ncbi:YjcZ family sporulation protein [Paenibacillus sp. R14(2021)]|nr:YjcZ family sporulation protein [Paenibacillus sp. R14(2021)]
MGYGMSNVGGVGQGYGPGCGGGYGAGFGAGGILVLFILLVIITRSWLF